MHLGPSGRVALVTGASRGRRKAWTAESAAEDVHVVVFLGHRGVTSINLKGQITFVLQQSDQAGFEPGESDAALGGEVCGVAGAAQQVFAGTRVRPRARGA